VHYLKCEDLRNGEDIFFSTYQQERRLGGLLGYGRPTWDTKGEIDTSIFVCSRIPEKSREKQLSQIKMPLFVTGMRGWGALIGMGPLGRNEIIR